MVHASSICSGCHRHFAGIETLDKNTVMILNLNASQKRGALILLVILGVVAIWRMRVFFAEGDSLAVNEVQAIESQMSKPDVRVELNSADSASLDSVSGIGPTFARRIVRYRQLIGGYTNTEQLMQVFGITPEAYLRMEPYVYVDTNSTSFAELRSARPNFKKQPKGQPWKKGSKSKGADSQNPTYHHPHYHSATSAAAPQLESAPVSQPSSTPVLGRTNLNTADSAALVRLPGIGPGTAGRIIKYRNRISFFRSLDQLNEVWGVRPENLEKMKPHLTVGDLDAFPKVHINEWDVEHLGRHPYIGFKDARILVAYREEHGPFKRVEDLRWVLGIDPLLPGRMEGYLQF